ncbi:hypothetical protein A2U01_0057823, partial [Trifolium medium]|nr:hypothetical protein [Trifolium medium]
VLTSGVCSSSEYLVVVMCFLLMSDVVPEGE